MTSDGSIPKMRAERDGVLKFDCRYRADLPDSTPVSAAEISGINELRRWLFEQQLIGVYPDGIGYGNISRRGNGRSFVISGTQTGALPVLEPAHYSRVTDYSIEGNWVACEGGAKASSESLTHAAVYEVSQEINVVAHVHNRELWERLMHVVPTTSQEITYGTPAMAAAIASCVRSAASSSGTIVMGGHAEGVLFFAPAATALRRVIESAIYGARDSVPRDQ